MAPYANSIPIKQTPIISETLSFPVAASNPKSGTIIQARSIGDDRMDVDIDEALEGIKEFRKQDHAFDMMELDAPWEYGEELNDAIVIIGQFQFADLLQESKSKSKNHN